MVAGVILILSQIGFVTGVFLLTFGLYEGAQDKKPYNWGATINGKSIGGLFLIIASMYWVYNLTGSFLPF
nr:hypothetical protein [Paenibacillus xylanexedens]